MYLKEEKLFVRTCKNKKCNKTFFTTHNQKLYCNPKCTPSYIKGTKRDTTKKYFYITWLRHHYFKLKRRNPILANTIIKQMIQEEGKQFTTLALGEGEIQNVI